MTTAAVIECPAGTAVNGCLYAADLTYSFIFHRDVSSAKSQQLLLAEAVKTSFQQPQHGAGVRAECVPRIVLYNVHSRYIIITYYQGTSAYFPILVTHTNRPEHNGDAACTFTPSTLCSFFVGYLLHTRDANSKTRKFLPLPLISESQTSALNMFLDRSHTVRGLSSCRKLEQRRAQRRALSALTSRCGTSLAFQWLKKRMVSSHSRSGRSTWLAKGCCIINNSNKLFWWKWCVFFAKDSLPFG